MDTSQSEDSDVDDEWVQSDVDMADDESARPNKRRFKNRVSRSGDNQNAGDVKDPEDEGSAAAMEKTASGVVCCTCSKFSSCKTMKCQCRVAKGICGASCGCVASKCSNRDGNMLKHDDLAREMSECAETGSGSEDIEKNRDLACHGAMLLQNALVEKPTEKNDDGVVRRKPLSDIGNTVVCSF